MDAKNNHDLLRYFRVLQNIHGVIRLTDLIVDTAFAYNNIETLFIEPALSAEYVAPEDVGKRESEAGSLLSVFESTKHLVVLGDPGSGKSTVVSWLTSRFATVSPNVYRARLDGLIPFPFVLRELDLSAVESWRDLVEQFCGRPEFQVHDEGEDSSLFDFNLVAKLMESGQALILFDGIDEVGSMGLRENLRRIANETEDKYPQVRWVFTSRIIGYEECPFYTNAILANLDRQLRSRSSERMESNAEVSLKPAQAVTDRDSRYGRFYIVPFDDSRIERYSTQWYGLLEKDPSRALASSHGFIRALQNHPSLADVARVPILLAFLALVHLRDVILPEGRTEVYKRIAEIFLYRIPVQRGLDKTLYRLDLKMRWVGEIALAMQARRVSNTKGSVLIEKEDLRLLLLRVMQVDDPHAVEADADGFLEFIARRAGLLLPRSGDEFGFVHLSFQEFFAGWGIAEVAEMRSFDPRNEGYHSESSTPFRCLQDQAEEGNLKPDTLPSLLEQWVSIPVMREPLLHAACLLTEDSILLFAQACAACPRSLGDPLPREDLLLALAAAGDNRLTDRPRGLLLLVAGGQPKNPWSRTADLWGTRITDAGLGHLSSLTGLQSLNLSETQITDAGLGRLSSLTGLQSLNLWGTRITDAGLGHLSSLTGLQSLNLSETQITDAGLGRLSSLTGLQSLNLSNTRITDAGLGRLSSLTGLQSLNLWRTEITDAGLGHLSSLTGLQSLNLSNTRITDAGLGRLSSLTGLQSLNLWGTRITDAGLGRLSSLTGLQSLNLSNTRITDAGLGRLSSLTGLQSLNLSNTRITDAGLGHLSSLTGLQSLNLSNTRITDAGLGRLSPLTGLQSLNLLNTRIAPTGMAELLSRLSQPDERLVYSMFQ